MKIREELIQDQSYTREEVAALYGFPVSTSMIKSKRESKARDAALDSTIDLLHASVPYGGGDMYPTFIGYGHCIALSQNGLIRSGVDMLANDMTRRWISLHLPMDEESDFSEEDANAYISEIEEEIKKYRLVKIFKKAITNCGYFGGCLVYIDIEEESDKDLLNPLVFKKETFPKGKLKGFKIIEPQNITPGTYNAFNPLSHDYYSPKIWYIQGKPVHSSRFLYFRMNEVVTTLLPSYNFFGIPLSQIVLDSVSHFTQCREASARLLTKFSLTVLKTNLDSILSGGAAEELYRRVDFFVQNRNNDGIEVIDMQNEDIVNISTPLSGVTDIVRQSLEMVAAYFKIPVTKFLGISPAGMNATGESDMQNYYDQINSLQEDIFRNPLEKALTILQLNQQGKVNENLYFEFELLSQDNKDKIVDAQSKKADIDLKLIDAGVISREEARERVANDPDSGYNLDTSIDIETDPAFLRNDEEFNEEEFESVLNEEESSNGKGSKAGDVHLKGEEYREEI